MRSVIDRLNDSDPIVKGIAEVEWRKLCKENGADPARAYSDAMLMIAKRQKTDVTKRSRVSFADVFTPLAPVAKAKAAYDEDDKWDDESKAINQAPKANAGSLESPGRRGKAAYDEDDKKRKHTMDADEDDKMSKGGKGPRLVAFDDDDEESKRKGKGRTVHAAAYDENDDKPRRKDKDGDKDDDGMDASENANRGVARRKDAADRLNHRGLSTKDKDGDKDDDGMSAAKDKDGDKDDDGMDASERAGRGVMRTKSVPGHRSAVRRGVSFQNIIDGSNHKVVTYDITSMPDRGPRAADRGQDRLGRLFDDGEYIAAGGLSGVETDPIPNAGSGPTREHDARGVPNSGFRPMQSGEGDRGHIVDDHGVMPVDLSFGSDEGGSYTRTELGQAGDVAVRVGPNFVLAAKDPFAPASNFKAPTSDASTLKSERVRKSLRRGTFANIVRGPEGGPTDGDNQSTL